MSRRVGDRTNIVAGLSMACLVASQRGDAARARAHYDESVAVAMSTGNQMQLHQALADLAWHVQSTSGDHETVLELKEQALQVARRSGNPYTTLTDEHNVACTLRMLGRLQEAYAMQRPLILTALAMNVTGNLMACAEDFAAMLAEVGDARRAAMLLGAADARHEEVGHPRLAQQESEIAPEIDKARAALEPAACDEAYAAGQATPIREALQQAYDATPESI
jgi:hypothetical protein